MPRKTITPLHPERYYLAAVMNFECAAHLTELGVKPKSIEELKEIVKDPKEFLAITQPIILGDSGYVAYPFTMSPDLQSGTSNIPGYSFQSSGSKDIPDTLVTPYGETPVVAVLDSCQIYGGVTRDFIIIEGLTQQSQFIE